MNSVPPGRIGAVHPTRGTEAIRLVDEPLRSALVELAAPNNPLMGAATSALRASRTARRSRGLAKAPAGVQATPPSRLGSTVAASAPAAPARITLAMLVCGLLQWLRRAHHCSTHRAARH
jgi:hypothetical protein